MSTREEQTAATKSKELAYWKQQEPVSLADSAQLMIDDLRATYLRTLRCLAESRVLLREITGRLRRNA